MEVLLIAVWVLAWVLAGPVLVALWKDEREAAKRESELVW